MCGISGIARFTDKAECEKKVRTMNSLIAHRGPDAEGMWSNNHCVLGHRRLSIIDTSEAGNQPFQIDNGELVIVFNGEIYNYLELRKELESTHTFSTQTDTEVILAAYKKWGIDCVHHFFGMFAFALWDEKQEQLIIARDRLGVKPLYYAETAQGLVFASEIRAVLSTGWIERRIHSNALADYLRYQTVHAPQTVIEGVHMLMPGHRMIISSKGVQTERWWDLVDSRVKLDGSESKESVHKHIHELLSSSVELRMRADVPFGAFLSGGIDSSIVVGLMSRTSSHPVNTFSITFQEQAYDESPYSELIAKRFNTRHTAIQLSAEHFLKMVPEALMAMDHPSGDGPNTYVVSKATRDAGVKMALSGLGGDEVFAGYDVFRRMKALETKQWINRMPFHWCAAAQREAISCNRKAGSSIGSGAHRPGAFLPAYPTGALRQRSEPFAQNNLVRIERCRAVGSSGERHSPAHSLQSKCARNFNLHAKCIAARRRPNEHGACP
jgi:asparagine synthase (glutamine-hydrolysing)